MLATPFRFISLGLATTLIGCASANSPTASTSSTHGRQPTASASHAAADPSVNVYYLEIVTPAVDQTCAALSRMQGITFGAPVPELGNARTASLNNGGRVGVRPPMRDDKAPVVRPYLLVNDIDAAVESAKAAGAEIAVPPMPIPGQGTIAIYLLAGIEHGLWQR